VQKKSGAYCYINAIIKYNIVIIRDALLFLDIDKVLEAFVSYKVFLLINFFLGYNQVSLDIKSKDITIFMSFLGLL
jgi:hypothetical protein